jgi:hypothetical protein
MESLFQSRKSQVSAWVQDAAVLIAALFGAVPSMACKC